MMRLKLFEEFIKESIFSPPWVDNKKIDKFNVKGSYSEKEACKLLKNDELYMKEVFDKPGSSSIIWSSKNGLILVLYTFISKDTNDYKWHLAFTDIRFSSLKVFVMSFKHPNTVNPAWFEFHKEFDNLGEVVDWLKKCDIKNAENIYGQIRNFYNIDDVYDMDMSSFENISLKKMMK